MTPLRVLVVSRDRLSRAGLAVVLDQQPGLSVVGQVFGDDDTSPPLGAYTPDVIVWDVSWETSNAVNGLASLPEGTPPGWRAPKRY